MCTSYHQVLCSCTSATNHCSQCPAMPLLKRNFCLNDLPLHVSVFSEAFLRSQRLFNLSELHGAFTFPSSEMHSLSCNLKVSSISQMSYGSRIIALKHQKLLTEHMLNIYLLKSKSNSQNAITFHTYLLFLFVATSSLVIKGMTTLVID